MNSDYSQPDFYRFNQDSITLSTFVSKFEQSKIDTLADLCCGCGIVSMEVSQMIDIGSIDYFEIQKDYLLHILRNIKSFSKARKNNIYISDLTNLNHFKSYEVITMNPPYFAINHSRPPKDQRRMKARMYKGDELKALIMWGLNSMNLSSRFYFCLPDSASKLVDEVVLEDSRNCQLKVYSEQISDIRYFKLLKL